MNSVGFAKTQKMKPKDLGCLAITALCTRQCLKKLNSYIISITGTLDNIIKSFCVLIRMKHVAHICAQDYSLGYYNSEVSPHVYKRREKYFVFQLCNTVGYSSAVNSNRLWLRQCIKIGDVLKWGIVQQRIKTGYRPAMY